MINVTEYLKNNDIYNEKVIPNFLRMTRIKYLIGNEKKVVSKAGRYNSFTLFSEDLFEVFVFWLEKKPIPLLNRKEYEVSIFIKSYFKDAISQYKLNSYIYDWYSPFHNLIIEFNENYHKKKSIIKIDKEKIDSIKDMNIFIINEESVMNDLSVLAKTYSHV